MSHKDKVRFPHARRVTAEVGCNQDNVLVFLGPSMGVFPVVNASQTLGEDSEGWPSSVPRLLLHLSNQYTYAPDRPDNMDAGLWSSVFVRRSVIMSGYIRRLDHDITTIVTQPQVTKVVYSGNLKPIEATLNTHAGLIKMCPCRRRH